MCLKHVKNDFTSIKIKTEKFVFLPHPPNKKVPFAPHPPDGASRRAAVRRRVMARVALQKQ